MLSGSWTSCKAWCPCATAPTSSWSATTSRMPATTTSTPSPQRLYPSARWVCCLCSVASSCVSHLNPTLIQPWACICARSVIIKTMHQIRVKFRGIYCKHTTKKVIINDYFNGFSLLHVLLQDDLIFLPHKVSSSVGHLGPLVLCTRVMNTLHLMEPASMRHTQVEVRTHTHALASSVSHLLTTSV